MYVTNFSGGNSNKSSQIHQSNELYYLYLNIWSHNIIRILNVVHQWFPNNTFHKVLWVYFLLSCLFFHNILGCKRYVYSAITVTCHLSMLFLNVNFQKLLIFLYQTFKQCHVQITHIKRYEWMFLIKWI